MIKEVELLRKTWKLSQIPIITSSEIQEFQNRHDVILPSDLKEYFLCVNGTAGEYDENFFKFFSLRQFETFPTLFRDWHGLPNYSELLHKFEDVKSYFVIAEYSINLLVYAIRLSKYSSLDNEVIVVSGGDYKRIANSFTDFVNIYLKDHTELFM